jgi:MoaA/NifB/PqqE/SkfB family radical SAM enzyme
MKQPIKITHSKPTINVYWILTDFCNFKCNYCPDFLHNGDFATGKTQGFPSYSEITVFMDKLKALVDNGTHLNLQFGGGEPTLHPNFLDIIKYMNAENVHLGVTTNGSRSDEWWREALPFLDNVTISLHPEFTKIDKVNDIAKFIASSGTDFMFNLSCDPARWDKVVGLYDKLDAEFKHSVTPKVLNYLDSTKENYKYTSEQTAWIKTHMGRPKSSDRFLNSIMHFDDGSTENLLLGRVTVNNWNEFKDWRCKVASQSIMIDYTGTVNAGICMAKSLGHITEFELDTSDIVCPFNFCPCPNDIKAEKYKV